MNVGAKIKEIRTSKGITQTYILKIVGKSSGWLSQIESGDRNIKVDDLNRVAKLLETPIEQFFLPTNFAIGKIVKNQTA